MSTSGRRSDILPWAFNRALARALTRMYGKSKLAQSWTEETVRDLDGAALRSERALALSMISSPAASFPVEELEPGMQEELVGAQEVVVLIERLLR